MFIVLIGPPGAGKGTQAQILSERLNLPHLATGQLFRDAIQAETPVGRLAKPYIDRGELVPDDVTIQFIKELLDRPQNQKGAILDGFPRTCDQAIWLDRELKDRGHRVDVALYFTVPVNELVRRLTQRWTCGQCETSYHLQKNPPQVEGRCDACGGDLYQRPDDTPDVVRRRLEVYEEQTAPLVDYYRNRGVLAEIPGNQPVEDVTRTIMSILQERSLLKLASRWQSR